MKAAFVVRSGGVIGSATDPVSATRAASVALRQAGANARGAVLAVDSAPFPAEAVVQAAESGVRALVRPDGSGADEQSRAAAANAGMSLLLAHTRHLRF